MSFISAPPIPASPARPAIPPSGPPAPPPWLIRAIKAGLNWHSAEIATIHTYRHAHPEISYRLYKGIILSVCSSKYV